MPVPDHIVERFRDRVRLELGAGRFLSREQEKALYLEAIACDIPLDEARALVESVAVGYQGRREIELDAVLSALMTTLVGDRGWLSRTDFERAAAACQTLSDGKIDRSTARIRIKRMMIENGWTIRGAVVFGVPKWFRDIPES
jgi:hypothetical protein